MNIGTVYICICMYVSMCYVSSHCLTWFIKMLHLRALRALDLLNHRWILDGKRFLTGRLKLCGEAVLKTQHSNM